MISLCFSPPGDGRPGGYPPARPFARSPARPEPGRPLVQHTGTDLDSLAYKMASCIPFYLRKALISDDPGPFGDYVVMSDDRDMANIASEPVVLPLTIASLAPHLPVAYGAWFRLQLSNLASWTGYGMMSWVADGGLRESSTLHRTGSTGL
jgi:hypothetical protein